MTDTGRWTALLDAMDEGLKSFPPVLVDALPTDLGPLPPVLAARAARTLQRMADGQAVLEQEQAELRRELTALSAAKAVAAGNAAPSVPHFLDTKA
jgi:hypothetical protein